MSLKPGKKGDANRAWNVRRKGEKAYSSAIKPINRTFLIVCEGKNTEPEYFRKFPVQSVEIIVKGMGRSKSSLVNEAKRLKAEPDFKGAEVWCVFDYDHKPDEADSQPADFNGAIEDATKSGIQVAWSNDSIELWFLLHYKYLDTALEREGYYPILKDVWGLESFSNEAKTRSFCENLYDLLNEGPANQAQAIERAKRLDEEHMTTGAPYHQRCPCTTIYRLVETLNAYIKN